MYSRIDILVSIDDALELDGAAIGLLLEHREDFRWVCWIDDDGVLALVIYDEVGVVVTTTLPFTLHQRLDLLYQRTDMAYTWESIGCAWLLIRWRAGSKSIDCLCSSAKPRL